MLAYFNEPTVHECGMCDVCLNHKNEYIDVSDAIIDYIKREKLANSHEICNHINATEATILLNLQALLSEEIININHLNQYHLKK